MCERERGMCAAFFGGVGWGGGERAGNGGGGGLSLRSPTSGAKREGWKREEGVACPPVHPLSHSPTHATSGSEVRVRGRRRARAEARPPARARATSPEWRWRRAPVSLNLHPPSLHHPSHLLLLLGRRLLLLRHLAEQVQLVVRVVRVGAGAGGRLLGGGGARGGASRGGASGRAARAGDRHARALAREACVCEGRGCVFFCEGRAVRYMGSHLVKERKAGPRRTRRGAEHKRRERQKRGPRTPARQRRARPLFSARHRSVLPLSSSYLAPSRAVMWEYHRAALTYFLASGLDARAA